MNLQSLMGLNQQISGQESSLSIWCNCLTHLRRCRDAASAELDTSLLLEVHVALQKITAIGVRPDLYQPMADAIWNLYDWLRALAESNQLVAKAFEGSERVWAGKEVRNFS